MSHKIAVNKQHKFNEELIRISHAYAMFFLVYYSPKITSKNKYFQICINIFNYCCAWIFNAHQVIMLMRSVRRCWSTTVGVVTNWKCKGTTYPWDTFATVATVRLLAMLRHFIFILQQLSGWLSVSTGGGSLSHTHMHEDVCVCVCLLHILKVITFTI